MKIEDYFITCEDKFFFYYKGYSIGRKIMGQIHYSGFWASFEKDDSYTLTKLWEKQHSISIGRTAERAPILECLNRKRPILYK